MWWGRPLGGAVSGTKHSREQSKIVKTIKKQQRTVKKQHR
jgi:hypothetical protein